jgi:hypothetical protein
MAKALTFLGKVLWLFQLVALSLMQGYALEPASPLGISSQSEYVKRVTYHRCGCPPEKVASHTCCCYTGKCTKPSGKTAAATCHPDHGGPTTSGLSLYACGCMEESFFLSAERYKFIGAFFIIYLSDRIIYFSPSLLGKPENPIFKPSIPPPQLEAAI